MKLDFYLWLGDWIAVEFDFPKVIARGHQLLVVGPGATVEVSAIYGFWPDPDSVEAHEARL